MKRLFTFMTMALSLAALSAMTVSPVRVSARKAARPVEKSTETRVVRHAKDTWSVPTGEWTSLGQGKITDDMVTAMYNYPALTWSVEVQQSVENPNYYRLVAPYGTAFKEAFEAANNVQLKDGEYDKDGTAMWVFDVSDPSAVYFPKTYINADWGHGPMYVGIPTTADPVWKDGVMTAAPRGIALGDDDGAVALNMRGQFRIVIPGATESDYRLTFTTRDECLTTRKTTGELFAGADIATVKCGVFADAFEDEMLSMYKQTVQSGSTVAFRGNVDVEMDAETNKIVIVFVGLDAAGNQVAQTWKTFYYVDAADSDDWQDEGVAKFTDGLVKTFYGVEIGTYECRLQRHKYRPGYLRLVNPYEKSPFNQDRYMHRGHDHFIYIVADDPDCIFFDQSPLGLDFGHGQCRVWSDVGYYLAAGFDIEECKELGMGIQIDGNVWTVPEEGAQFSAMEYDNADWYMCPEGTKIEMPETFVLSVGDIAADDDDNAPVEYFNLQGVKVNHPAAGLYLRRQGSRVAKVLIK